MIRFTLGLAYPIQSMAFLVLFSPIGNPRFCDHIEHQVDKGSIHDIYNAAKLDELPGEQLLDTEMSSKRCRYESFTPAYPGDYLSGYQQPLYQLAREGFEKQREDSLPNWEKVDRLTLLRGMTNELFTLPGNVDQSYSPVGHPSVSDEVYLSAHDEHALTVLEQLEDLCRKSNVAKPNPSIPSQGPSFDARLINNRNEARGPPNFTPPRSSCVASMLQPSSDHSPKSFQQMRGQHPDQKLPETQSMATPVEMNSLSTLGNQKSIPYTTSESIYEKLLEETMLRYKGKIDELESLCLDFQCSPTRIYFEGVRACQLFKNVGEGMPASILSFLDRAGHFIVPTRMLGPLERLNKHILFNHAAFMHRVGVKIQFSEIRVDGLLDMLFVEFFTPRNGHPLLGRVLRPILSHTSDAFSPIQKILISQIECSKPEQNAFANSIELIKYWYRHNYPEIENSELQVNSDEKFNQFLSESIRFYISFNSDKKAHQKETEDNLPLACGWLDNLLVPEPKALLATSAKAVWTLGHEPDIASSNYPILGTQASNILTKLKLINNESHERFFRQVDEFSDLLVGISTSREKNFNGDSSCIVRLLHVTSKRVVSSQTTYSKLLALLKHLQYYHTALLSVLTPDRREIIEITNESLFHWLDGELFAPKDGYYPIFGIIKGEYRPRNKCAFRRVQTYLINYFTLNQKRRQLNLNLTAIALIGYWYKNELGDLWKAHFSDDMGYWHYIAREILGGS